MSGTAPIEPVAPGTERTDRWDRALHDGGGNGTSDPGSPPTEPSWRVRGALHDDAPAVAAAVRGLLLELGGTPPATSAMEDAARALLDDRQTGALLVAEAEAAIGDAEAAAVIVGVLGASWQTAIHVPGRYALIQDLWVHPDWRGRAIGGGLLSALFERARELEITRVEVGLPPERFPGLAATQAFYRANGFTALGARMRRGLP